MTKQLTQASTELWAEKGYSPVQEVDKERFQPVVTCVEMIPYEVTENYRRCGLQSGRATREPIA